MEKEEKEQPKEEEIIKKENTKIRIFFISALSPSN